MAKYKDANPVSGAKGGGGMKNHDARINGGYDKQVKPDFNPKLTFNPNEDARQLPQQKGLEEGAY